jgi:glycosyltransferase involved in cell wall biosynthesis
MVPEQGRRRPRVVVVAQAAPAQGGIATFAETIVADHRLAAAFDMRLLNTTRRAVRVGGAMSAANAWHAVVDAVRVFRASRGTAVVHVQTALLPALPLLRALAICRAAQLGGAAVLCHVHTGLANTGPHETFVPTRPERFLLRRFGFVSAVLTVSRAGMAGLAPFVPGAPMDVVDNAVDLRGFETGQAPAAPPVVLFVGTLARRKGLLDLLMAARLLRARGMVDWRLEVVGAGNEAGDREADAVRRAFADAGMEDSLLGPLGGAVLRARLGSASIYVLPSHSEGQPIGILEAMASGLPVVATRVGGIPDVVREGVDGLLVDPGRPEELADSLASLIASPDLRSRMGESGRRRAEDRYDVARLSERLGELYARAMRERRAR